MKFEVPGKPQGKQRVRVCVRGGYAKAYTPEETASYENLIMLSFKASNESYLIPRGTPVRIRIDAIYAVPKSFSKKRTNEALNGNLKPLTKPDIDNVAKVVCDALNGVAYDDDSQVVEIVATKIYGNVPKLVVNIESLNI